MGYLFGLDGGTGFAGYLEFDDDVWWLKLFWAVGYRLSVDHGLLLVKFLPHYGIFRATESATGSLITPYYGKKEISSKCALEYHESPYGI